MLTVDDEQHPVFGRLPVVYSKSEVAKADVAIVRTEHENSVVAEQRYGPATHLSEVVCYITVDGVPSYHVVRDEIFRTKYRLKAIDSFTPQPLSGLYSSSEKAVDAVVEYHREQIRSANS